MRDFLQNFRMASEHLQPGENEENDTTDEDTSDYFDQRMLIQKRK